MSIENKTRLEVQEILKSCIEEGLKRFGYTRWSAKEFANASFQNADGVVLMNRLRSHRVGWQAHHYIIPTNSLTRVDELIDEQHWQLSVIKKRTNTTTAGDALAEDVADNLVTWFNGVGCEWLRGSGVANLRIDADSVIVYNDNSDLYQKRAVFTVKLQVPKEVKQEQAEIAAVKPTLMPI